MSYTYTTLKQAILDYTENDETTFVSNLPLFIKNTEERILKNVQLSLFQKNDAGAMSASNKFLGVPSDFLAPFALSFTNSSGNVVFLDFKDSNFVQSFNPDATVTGPPRYYAQYDLNNLILSPTPDSGYAAEIHYFYRPTSLTKSQTTFSVAYTGPTVFSAGETIIATPAGATSSTANSSFIVTGTTGTGNTTLTANFPAGLTDAYPRGTAASGTALLGNTSGAVAVINSVPSGTTSEEIVPDITTTWISENADLALLYGSLMEAYVFMKGEQDMQVLYEKRFVEAIMGLKLLGESKEVTDEYRTGPVVRQKQ